MSHHSTSHHHCTTFHITLLHTNAPCLTSQLMLQQISPRTTIFYIWDHITLQSAWATPFHIISWSTCSTSHTIPHPQLFHTTPTAYFTPHVPHRITPPCLDFTSHHHIHIWHHTTITPHCLCHILHHHNSTPPHFTSHRNFPHFLHYATFHIPGQYIPLHAIFHITHSAF